LICRIVKLLTGPTLYIIMESDLKTLSHRNLFCKYADDTNLSVPDKSDFGLNEEFIKIENWARMNKLIINLGKTKEIVFRRPSLRHFYQPSAYQ